MPKRTRIIEATEETRNHARRPAPHLRALVGAVLVTGLLGLPACTSAEPGLIELPSPPNVLIILTDDQRAVGTMVAMPATRRLFKRGGTYFPDAVTTTPLCCPSRASIFTGRYAHNHGIHVRVSEAPRFDHETMLHRYLHDNGYRTGFFGKYLNGWPLEEDPQALDRWAIFSHSLYAGYRGGNWNVNGSQRVVDEYSTTFLTEQARAFIRASEDDDQAPWAMFVNTGAPHKPAIPQKRYERASVPRFHLSDRLYERDASDKPRFVRKLRVRRWRIKRLRAAQLRTLMSVDDMVEQIFAAMGRYGERDTIAFFMSDNGNLWGDHGSHGKFLPYEMSIRIPFFMRWPGKVGRGAVDRRMAATIDVTPTIFDALSLEPQHAMDGRSLFERWDRDRILIEFWESFHLPTWASIWSDRYQFTEYYRSDGTVRVREHYNLKKDPFQNRNVLADGDRSNDPDIRRLSERLARYRECSEERCP